MAVKPTEPWDETNPPNSQDAGQGDNRIRELKTQLREVIGSDHSFPTSPDQSETHGYHTILHLIQQSTPSLIVDIGQLYVKNVDTDHTELFYLDEDGNEVQLTNLGTVVGSGPKQGNQGDDFVSNEANGHGLAYNTVAGQITETGTGVGNFFEETDIECEITAVANDIIEVTLQGVFMGSVDNKYIKARPKKTDGDTLLLIGTGTISGVVNDDMTTPGETIVTTQLYRVDTSGVIKFAMEWSGRSGIEMEATDRVLIAKVI